MTKGKEIDPTKERILGRYFFIDEEDYPRWVASIFANTQFVDELHFWVAKLLASHRSCTDVFGRTRPLSDLFPDGWPCDAAVQKATETLLSELLGLRTALRKVVAGKDLRPFDRIEGLLFCGASEMSLSTVEAVERQWALISRLCWCIPDNIETVLERDRLGKFLYERAAAGEVWREIVVAAQAAFPDARVNTPNSVKRAVESYRKRHSLPPIEVRPRGRKRRRD